MVDGEKPLSDRDVYILEKEALLQLLGAMALPPWQDDSGTWIGGNIDCAPLADRIVKWLAEHDLSNSVFMGLQNVIIVPLR